MIIIFSLRTSKYNKELKMKKVLAIVTLFSFIVAGDMGLTAYGGLN